MSSSSNIHSKFKKLIKEDKLKELEENVIETGSTKILKLIDSLLKVPEGITLVDGLLNALQGITRESLDCRVKIFNHVFEHCRIASSSRGSAGSQSGGGTLGTLVGVLLRHVESFPSDVLILLMDQYVEHIKIKDPLHGRWVDLFPKVMRCLSNCEEVTFRNRKMLGADYKYEILKSLYDYDWPAQTTSTILLALREMDLDKEDLSDVVRKVESVLRTLDYQSVPPIIYNLMLLTQGKQSGAALKAIVTFFNKQEEEVVSKEKEMEKNTTEELEIDSADVTIETEGLIQKKRNLREAEGTVILHLTHLAQYDSCIAEDHLKLLKSSTWLTHILCSSFNLPLTLSLASIDRYEEKVLLSVKSCILSHLKQSHKLTSSAWYRKCWQKTNVDLVNVLKNTVNNCTVGWEHVTSGLCLVLLGLLEGGVSPLKSEAGALAVRTLSLLIPKHQQLAQHTLKHLTNSILTCPSPSHYIEVLGRLCRTSPLLMMEHHNLVREVLVEQLQFLTLPTAVHILTTCANLLKVDIPIRDALIIALRKMLFSKSVNNRLVAVRGVISLLKQLRVTTSLPSSQASHSFSSSLSQISSSQVSSSRNPSSRNQSLCIELLGMLRRCFSQQPQVRETLYKGLHDVCRSNPKLCSTIVTALHLHVVTFLDLKEDKLNPVVLRKTFSMQGEVATLVEPLGELLACLASCTVYYEKKRKEISNNDTCLELEGDDEDDTIAEVTEISKMFTILTNKLSTCDMDDLNITARTEFSNSDAGLKNLMNAQTMVEVYDGLLLHSFLKSGSVTEELMSLFKMRQSIASLVINKGPKLSSKKAGEGSKGKKNCTFPSILSLEAVSDLITAELGKTDSEVEKNIEFQVYLLNTVENHVNQYKNLLQLEKDRNLAHLRAIAKMLFFECFDNVTASEEESQVNKINQCLSLLNSLFGLFTTYHKDRIVHIYREITGKSANKDLNSLCFTLVKACQKMIAKIFNQEELMKDATIILKIILKVIEHMSHDCNELEKTYDWFNSCAREHDITHSPLCECLMRVLLNVSSQLKTFPDIYLQICQDIHKCLGDIDKSVSIGEQQKDFSIINDDSVVGVLNVLMEFIDEDLSLLEMSLNKQKAFLSTATEHEAEKVEEKINVKLGNLIRAFSEIIRSALPTQVMNIIIKKAEKLYIVLAQCVNYYLELYRVKVNPRLSEKFERLLNMSFEQLSEPVYLLLNYVEDIRSDQKKAAFQRAVKESKLIPALVFSMEKYEKAVIQLSKKSKINLHEKMKLSTLRDFKIEASKLQESESENEEPEDNSSQRKRKSSQENATQLSKKRKTGED